MMQLSKKQMEQYLRKSYSAVDGLWFVKLEEKFGFEAALDRDKEVWKVMAKIQSRALRSILAGPAGEAPDLRKSFSAKLALDGFQFVARTLKRGGFVMIVRTCPWYEILVKAGRQECAERIGAAICGCEYAVWAQEFGDTYAMDLESRICQGDNVCRINFIVK